MFAIFKSCGKQYKVQEGDVVFLEKLDAAEGEDVTFKDVVLFSGENGLSIGNPTVKDCVVKAKVIKNGKSKKITVFRYKAKKNEKTKMGHRQPYTKVQISKIGK